MGGVGEFKSSQLLLMTNRIYKRVYVADFHRLLLQHKRDGTDRCNLIGWIVIGILIDDGI